MTKYFIKLFVIKNKLFKTFFRKENALKIFIENTLKEVIAKMFPLQQPQK